jgi:hypothetical protein
LAARVLKPFGWPPERLQRCMDACEQHHAPRSRMALGLEVELIRQSDLVDVTAGLVNFGLDRGWLRGLSAKSRETGSGASSARRSSASCATARRASPASFSPHDARDHRRKPEGCFACLPVVFGDPTCGRARRRRGHRGADHSPCQPGFLGEPERPPGRPASSRCSATLRRRRLQGRAAGARSRPATRARVRPRLRSSRAPGQRTRSSS